MQPITINFGAWLPDIASYNNPGVVEALNVYPVTGGFSPFGDANGTGDTTSEAVTGSEMFFRNDKTFVTVAGSSTKLIVRSGSTVTETSGFTAISQEHAWRFDRFKDYIIAVSPNNASQYISDIDTVTTWLPLPGSPPKAAVVGRVGDFLMMGDLTDIDGTVAPNRVRWSAFNNPLANWVTDRGELSDYRDLDPKYGSVTGVAGNLIFQERAIHRATFVGAPKVFDIVPVSTDRGCIAPGSLVEVGANVYFLGPDGFYVTNGVAVDQIGANKIDRWFMDHVLSSSIGRTHGAMSWPKQSIVWAFISGDVSQFTKQVIFSFSTGEWSSSDLPVNYIVRSKTDAVTLGDLAVTYPTGLTPIGVIGNPEFMPSDLLLSAWVKIGAGSEFATLDGSARNAKLTTGDRQLAPGRRTRISGILPLVENQSGNSRVQILHRNKLAAPQTATSLSVEGANGQCPQNVDARYVQVRMDIPVGAVWDMATGVIVSARVSGAR